MRNGCCRTAVLDTGLMLTNVVNGLQTRFAYDFTSLHQSPWNWFLTNCVYPVGIQAREN